MKAIRILLVLIFVSFISLTAQGANWDSVYDTWDVITTVEGGLSFRFSWAASPSVELIFLQVKIDDYLPIDFGGRISGVLSSYKNDIEGTEQGWFQIGVGALGTAHISFDNLQDHTLPYLENFDFFINLGIVYNYFQYSENYTDLFFPIGIATLAGARYFFLDWFGATFEFGYWAYSPQVYLGVTAKF